MAKDNASPAEDDKDGATAAAKKTGGAVEDAGGKGSKPRRRGNRPEAIPGLNPTWWAPVMVGLMVVGLLWIVVFYMGTDNIDNALPIPGIGYWNLGIGFGMIMAGFMMTTRWK